MSETRMKETSDKRTRVLALLGNEAIGRGLVEAGCHIALSYPGTPSSEVLPAVVRFAKEEKVDLIANWCANEKVALEQALAASYAGKRTAVIMKQVGLNVAADPLMSAAYIGVIGGLVIIVADDPGPTSSQTEQDTRQFAHFAKVPVLDPASPAEAMQMIAYGYELSEKHQTPVILRAALRVCHGRQNVTLSTPRVIDRPADFQRDPARWAATPRHRYHLHVALNERLKTIAAEHEQSRPFIELIDGEADCPLAVIAAGHPFSVLMDLLAEHGLTGRIPILKVGAPYPFPRKVVEGFVARHQHVLVIEETDQVIELLLDDRSRVMGRHDGTLPDAGALDADVIGRVMTDLLTRFGVIETPWETAAEVADLVASLQLPVRPPTLCPACPHRVSFFAIRQAGGKKGIFTSDIGCYTLGVNQGAVDTCHDMGAAISMASGLYLAHAHGGAAAAGSKASKPPPVIATIGDSTFYHGGLPPLADAVYADARFVLVILDNLVTAMTGMQPTLSCGVQADGMLGKVLDIEATCRGLGVPWVEVVDPADVPTMVKALKRAIAFNRDPDGGVAVLVARRACVINEPASFERLPIEITDRCNLCGICLDQFGCPALVEAKDIVEVDPNICIDCGHCIHSCARGAIVPAKGQGA